MCGYCIKAVIGNRVIAYFWDLLDLVVVKSMFPTQRVNLAKRESIVKMLQLLYILLDIDIKDVGVL